MKKYIRIYLNLANLLPVYYLIINIILYFLKRYMHYRISKVLEMFLIYDFRNVNFIDFIGLDVFFYVLRKYYQYPVKILPWYQK